mmetsp:Transcript_29034/g.81808  ORF Transcript_29034/g.81808 Transcript_29034/m.81808 type:complete len:437 (-) Transcript_29034:332-1642(-)
MSQADPHQQPRLEGDEAAAGQPQPDQPPCLTTLSTPLTVRCLQHLSPEDIMSVGGACRQLRAVSLDEAELWRPIFTKKWDLPASAAEASGQSDGTVCRWYWEHEWLLEGVSHLPDLSHSVEQWPRVADVARALSSTLVTGNNVERTCQTLAAHGAGDSLIRSCTVLLSTTWKPGESSWAFNALAAAVALWLHLGHRGDHREYRNQLADLAASLQACLEKCQDQTRGFLVTLAALLSVVQQALWLGSAQGTSTASGHDPQKLGVADSSPEGGRLPRRRHPKKPGSGPDDIRRLGGSWKGLRFQCTQHTEPEVTMSLTLVVKPDNKTVTAVGKDSIGSFTMDGSIMQLEDFAPSNSRAAGWPLARIRLVLTYREYGGIPASLIHLVSRQPQTLVLHGQITPLGIQGCCTTLQQESLQGTDVPELPIRGTFILWPRSGK